jgi:hypothetical protein
MRARCVHMQNPPSFCRSNKFCQDQSSCLPCSQFRPKRRKSTSDEVGIHEMNHASLAKKKLPGEGGLSGCIGPEMIMQRGDRTVRVLTIEPISLLLAAGN